MVPERIGRYDIKAELGRGGMATVYRGYDPRFKRDVAIKMMPAQFLGDPIFRARFEREAQTIAAIEHPAIVPVYDFGEENGQPYLIMRFMPGGSLADRLQKGPLATAEILHIIARLASALDQVHAHGIIHRDIKPANILFDQYNEAYLSDFGIARLTESTSMLTGDAIIGTPAYMSPEQARGDTSIDGRSDLYALGAILYQMLSGKLPYEATTPIGIAMKHITEPVPNVLTARPDLSPAYQQVIEESMAKERNQRYASGNDLVSALETAGHDLPPLAKPAPPSPHSAPPRVAPAPAVKVSAPPVAVPQPRSPASHPPQPARPPTGPIAVAPPRPRQGIKIPRWVWIAGVVVIVGGVCGLFGLGSVWSLITRDQPTPTKEVSLVQNTPVTPSPVETAFPTDTSAPLATSSIGPSPYPGKVIFQDDFSNPGSGWTTHQGSDGIANYVYESFRIYVDVPDRLLWSNPLKHYGDVIVQVDASKVAGPDDNYFGIICRYKDEANFYFLGITSSGLYAIGKREAGSITLLGSGNFQYSNMIHQGTTTNFLRADCVGNTLSLYANDSKLAGTQTTESSEGDVGLLVGTSTNYGADILFDNFVVETP